MSIQKVFLSEFEIYPLSRVEVEHVLSAGSYPFCRYGDKLSNEALEPAGSVKAADLVCNLFKKE